MKNFVTFLGKEGYAENFKESRIIPPGETKQHLLYDLPGGPSRVLYLSNIVPQTTPVGFILSNGEKIGEWIHWLPFVRFGRLKGFPNRRVLQLYEVHHDRPWTKESILMATPPPYSIFKLARPEGREMIVDVSKFKDFENPSRIRSTLLLAPITNTWVLPLMELHGYREINLID